MARPDVPGGWLPGLAGVLAIALPVALALNAGVDERAQFIFDINTEPESLDTAVVSGQPGGRVINCLFEGLMQRHPVTLEPIPAVAYRHTVSADGKTYTFHLRNCQWSNGAPVKASDFVFQWERVLDPASAGRYASILFPIANAERYNAGDLENFSEVGAEALDDSTLVVTLTHPTAYFLDLCAFYPYFPSHPPTVKAHGEGWIKPEHIVSNGPFVLERWELKRQIFMRKNPRYWDAEHVHLESLATVPVEKASTAFNLFLSGQTDWIDSGGFPLFVVGDVLDAPYMHRAPYLSTYFFRVNVTRPPFDDKRVRQALNMAIDKAAIVQFITRGGQLPAPHLVPPGVPNYESPAGRPYDPDGARALLAEAGYPGGAGFPSFELMFNTSEAHKQIAEVVQQQWKEVLGIECELRNQEWKVFLNTTRALDYDVSRAGWIGDYLDASTFLNIFLPGDGNNRTGWDHPPYTRLIRAAMNETDTDRRRQLLYEAETILLEEAPIIPIYFYVALNGYDGGRWGGCEVNLLNIPFPKYIYEIGKDTPHPVLTDPRYAARGRAR